MLFTQYYLDCLSQASYLVGDETTGQAVVVDPRRDVADYLADARAADLRIVGVINTHFHADFVSGHLELARETGAWIGYGDVAAPEFAPVSYTHLDVYKRQDQVGTRDRRGEVADDATRVGVVQAERVGREQPTGRLGDRAHPDAEPDR